MVLGSTGGIVEVPLEAGDVQFFWWGFLNYGPELMKVKLSAAGEGSEFIFFPDKIYIGPRPERIWQKYYIKIPWDYTKSVVLNPAVYASLEAIDAGQTKIIIRHRKKVKLNINPQPEPLVR